jgi:hypothetical protein
MSKLSNYLEQKLLDHIYNEVALSVPTTTYVALYTTDPTDANTGTEVSGGSYARVLVNENGGGSPAWDLAVVDGIGYKVDNANDITFPTATAAWGTVTHVGILDAITGGNLLHHTILDSSQVVGDGGIFKFLAGTLELRLE